MDDFQTVMKWVTLLPEVGTPILNDREAIIALVREAAELERQVSAKRGEAYRASLALEGRIRGQWNDAEIQEAKTKAEQ
jgi:hypothetical protein